MGEIKKYLMMLFAVAVTATMVSGCSNNKDDDDGDDEVTLAEKVDGVYEGTYSSILFEGDIEVKVTRTAAETVTIDFGTIAFDELGTVTIPAVTGVDLTGTTTSVGIAKTVNNITASGVFGGENVTFNVSLTITGTIKTGTAMNFKISLTSDDDPIAEYSPVEITIAADRVDEDEE